MTFSRLTFLLVLSAAAPFSYAAAPALDNTGYAPPYSAHGYWGGWDNGMNGGYGFAPWQLSTTSADFQENGFSVNSAFTNGGQGDPFPQSIDVLIGSWDLSAKDGNTASAIRPFTSGGVNGSAVLGAGQQLKLSIDTGYVNEQGGVVGFGLQNSAGANRVEFYFVGGRTDYTLNIGGLEIDTGIPWTQRGLNLTFTQLSPTGAFTLQVNPLEGGQYLLPGVAFAGDISQIRLFNHDSDPIGIALNNTPTPFYQPYFNRFELVDVATVPEPTTVGLLVSGLAIAGIAHRRSRSQRR